MFETRLGILVQTLIWKTSKHGQRGAILLGGRELVRGLRGTRTFHLFHLVCKFPWIFAWFGFCGCCFVWLVCLFLLAFAFGEICFLSSLFPVVDRQCLALVRQCRKKNSVVAKAFTILLQLWSTARSPSCATKNLLLIQKREKPCDRTKTSAIDRQDGTIACKASTSCRYWKNAGFFIDTSQLYCRPAPLRHNVPHRLLSAHSDC